jgi:phosphatidylglycerol:prolipoprotein diacylglycerol transferase
VAASLTIEFLHPVLLTVAGGATAALAWMAPARLREIPWWNWAALAGGCVIAAGAALFGFVPWLGQLHLAIYALCMVVGFAVAFALMVRRAAVLGVPRERLIDCFLIALVLGVVGARLRYVYERWDQFLSDAHGDLHRAVIAAADLDRGGAVWYGGVLMATLGIMAYLRWRRIAWLSFADITLPALLAGLAVGRIGCWFNGCCYGAPTDLPWGVTCAHYPGQHVHPTQLYETAACAVLATGLMWFWRRRRRDGQVAFWAIIGYGAWRFVNEGLRGDADVFAFHGLMTTSQATSLWLILGGVVGALVVGWRRRADPAVAERESRVPGSIHARVLANGSASPESSLAST